MAPFAPKFRNLVDVLAATVARHADRPFLGTRRDGRWEWLSYGDFARQVDRCRAALAARGLGPGERVALITANRVEWAVTAYAGYGLGVANVPMYESQQAREWRYILRDSGAALVVVSTDAIRRQIEALRSELPALRHVVCCEAPPDDPGSFAALLAAGDARPVPAAPPADDAIAGFIYTSGTTGAPKGVLLSHLNLAANIGAVQDTLPFTHEDRSLAFLPWAHSFGQVVELHGMCMLGGSLALCPDAARLPELLVEVRPTVLAAVPRVFNRIHEGVRRELAQHPELIQGLFRAGLQARAKVRRGQPLSTGERLRLALATRLVFRPIVARLGGRLRLVCSGGAALSREVAEFIDDLGVVVYEGYGLTETSPIATTNLPGSRRIGSVGKAIPGVRVELDFSASDEPGQGEIVVFGHNVMQGYHGLPEETALAIGPDGGLRTGDLGRFDADGFLYVTGRLKEIYKLENGKYVSPAPLEEQLQLGPYVLQAMVHGQNRPWNVAIVVPNLANLRGWAQARGLGALDDDALRSHPEVRALLRQELDARSRDFRPFEKIRDFVIAEEEFTTANDLLTPSLKVKRRHVVRRWEFQIDAIYGAPEQRPIVA
jgi:long-chain acyl-CoA synthetase